MIYSNVFLLLEDDKGHTFRSNWLITEYIGNCERAADILKINDRVIIIRVVLAVSSRLETMLFQKVFKDIHFTDISVFTKSLPSVLNATTLIPDLQAHFHDILTP